MNTAQAQLGSAPFFRILIHFGSLYRIKAYVSVCFLLEYIFKITQKNNFLLLAGEVFNNVEKRGESVTLSLSFR